MTIKTTTRQEFKLRDRTLQLIVKRDPRARKMVLRIDARSRGIILTLPVFLDESQGLLFLRKRSSWIFKRLDALPNKILLGEGIVIPLLDKNHIVRHDPGQKEVVIKCNGIIRMGGLIEHLPRRLNDWLSKEAKAIIKPKAVIMAQHLNKNVGRITIRDTRSRWGSCSPNGNLSFCWRLVMCPEWVINYVVAHEVSHLCFMNHSREFWETVGIFNVSVKLAREW